jgi:hypothetical protein
MSLKTPGILATLAICSFFAFSSCNGMMGKGKNDSTPADPADVNEVNIHNDYKMSIPKHMYSSKELNDDASLQYNDTAVEEYVIVIDESKTDFIRDFSSDDTYNDKETPERNYRTVQMSSMKEKMDTKSGPNIKAVKINGLDAEIVDFVASVDGIESDIYYKIAFIEGTKNMYMVMTWTLANMKNTHTAEMTQMLMSFKLAK